MKHLPTRKLPPLHIDVSVRVKTRIVSPGGVILKESPWQKNLVLDKGLNALARSTANALETYPAASGIRCQIGSGNNANSFASGAITFTQTGTTVTASGGFFTAAMVGGIFKYGNGSGGAEYYITAFTSSTVVTVDTSAEVAVPEVATVWMVQQTALQTFLFQTGTFQTNAGDCQTTVTGGNTIIHKRTYIFPQQGSPYNVNEIGWTSTTSSAHCLGRLVLSSTDVVGTSNFYVVVLEQSFVYSPGTPTAVGNVGTNIDTSGNIAIEAFAGIATIASSGSVAAPLVPGCNIEGHTFGNPATYWCIADYTQNAAPTGLAVSPTLTWPSIVQPSGTPTWTYAGTRGKMTLTNNTSITTAGQSARGVGIGAVSTTRPVLDVKFTTPFTLPTGTFQPITVWSCTYGRTLVN